MPEPMIIESIEEEFVEESATNPILEALNELPEAAIQQPVRMLPHFFLNHPKAFESSCPSSPPPLCNVPGPSSPSIVGLDVLRSYAGRPTERYHPSTRPTALHRNQHHYCSFLSQLSRRSTGSSSHSRHHVIRHEAYIAPHHSQTPDAKS
ncbi:hypothetical protein MHU86_18007 [Fragilaria crotonensis]|nr:hypothetical protein MHU86_18007 [Fragilaria crotonensis]